MDAKLKANWLAVTGVILGIVLLIGVVEGHVPPSGWRTSLMVGVTLIGFAGIFTWTYFNRIMSTPYKQPNWPQRNPANYLASTEVQLFSAPLGQDQIQATEDQNNEI